MRRALRAFGASDSGTAILEFALVLPLFLVLIAGTFEVGRMLLTRLALERAVESGARYLARIQDPGCRPACSPGARHALDMVRDDIVANTRLSRDVIRVTSVGQAADAAIRMDAEADVSLDLFAQVGLPVAWTLSASHEERRNVE